MSNRKAGTRFETYLCDKLSEKGFWAHNLAQNKHGQPADIIAVKNGRACLIDCKVCSTDKGFPLSRIEENQKTAMELWAACGNGVGWFAFLLPDKKIYMVSYQRLILWEKRVIPLHEIPKCWAFDAWVETWT